MHMILDWQKINFGVGLLWDPWNRLDRCEGSPWAVVLCCSRSVPWCGAIPGLSTADALLQGMQLSQGAVGSWWSVGEFHHALDLDLHLHGLNRKKAKYMSMRQKNKLHPSFVSTSTVLTFWALQAAGTGATVMGFPNGGVATTVNDGTDFTWGDLPIIAAGNTYDLCWCNGTASACEYLGIDGPGGWPGCNCFSSLWNLKSTFFFSPSFLGVLEFADVLMMFLKQNWTKKGSKDGGDAKIYVYILYIDFLFVCLNLELVSFQISTFQFPINPSTLHVSQPEAEDGSGLLGPFGSLAFWRAFRRTSKRNGSLSCRLTMWDQQFWGTSHWEARTELVSKGFGAKFCQRVCWLD